MTIEEKAKAYDEAVNKLRRFMAQGVEPLITRADVQDFFPELKESEDERVKKELIELISCMHDADPRKKGWIAWLEKQGTSYTKRNVDDAYLKGVRDTKNEIEKQYEANYQTRKDIATFIFNYRGDIKDRAKWMDYLGIKVSFVGEQGEQKPADKVEPKFKVKYAGNEYNVFETKDIAGVTFYGIEDEPNHIDYVKAENCEIISVYAIKENGSPYPTKPAVFSEKKPKRMISAEAKECIYGSDNEQVSSEKIGKNDTLLDLLNKMPSCITVDGIDYHFVMKKTSIYLAYYACYNGNGEEGRGNAIFGITAHSPIDLLAEMLEILKEKGLLE